MGRILTTPQSVNCWTNQNKPDTFSMHTGMYTHHGSSHWDLSVVYIHVQAFVCTMLVEVGAYYDAKSDVA